jgi:long-subunit acyl-CoA synthetase (AMP-forming)
MISHDNYTWVAKATVKRFGFDKPEKERNGRGLSLLPLSHVASQLVDLVICPMMGGNLFFADASALQGNLVKFLLVSKP